MSYSIAEAKEEREDAIVTALNERDASALRGLARLTMEEGDEELADYLQKQARRIDEEDDAYDEEDAIVTALNERDASALRGLAQLTGDEELADYLQKQARRIDEEDDAYDEERDYQMSLQP